MGTLYVVATPIGNLEDVTLRALRVLREVEVVLAEDTRRTRTLLTRHDVRKRPRSLHAHNEVQRSREVLQALGSGSSVALVSDAGTPLVSDPGERLRRNSRRVQPRRMDQCWAEIRPQVRAVATKATTKAPAVMATAGRRATSPSAYRRSVQAPTPSVPASNSTCR